MSGRTPSDSASRQHASGPGHRFKQPAHFGRFSITVSASADPSPTDSAALQECAGVASSTTHDSTLARPYRAHNCAERKNKAGRKKFGLGARLYDQTKRAKEEARLRVTCRFGKGICRHKSLAFSPACCCITTSRADPLQARMPPDGYPRRSPYSVIARTPLRLFTTDFLTSKLCVTCNHLFSVV